MKLETEDVTFQGLVTYLILPFISSDTFKNSTTPSVYGRASFKASGSVVTITNFLKGNDGQPISILGDGTTTVANNANIVTNTGANKLLALNKVYRFTYFKASKMWHEDA